MVFKQISDSQKKSSTNTIVSDSDFVSQVIKSDIAKLNPPEVAKVITRSIFKELSQDQINASKHISQLEELKSQATQEGLLKGEAIGFKIGKDKGYEAGYLEGITQSKQKFDAESAECLSRFKADLLELLYEISVSVQNWSVEAERLLCLKTAHICETILGAELEINQDYILEYVRSTLDECNARGSVKVRVNPLDKATLVAHSDWFTQNLNHIDGIEVIADPSIKSGCIVESPMGNFTATIESKLATLDDSIQFKVMDEQENIPILLQSNSEPSDEEAA